MSDLNALKNQFMSLQRSASSFKLSERTVVEIINKVIKRGKVHLLHTTTGREYVVEEKVNFEIANEIKKKKKISTLELAKVLELPLSVIEEKLEKVLCQNKTFILIDNKIVTKEYIEKVVNDIKGILTMYSSASISELANQFDLPIDFIKKFLEEKIISGEIKDVKLYPTRIITDYYIEIQTKLIRPALIASIVPVNIATLISSYNIDEMLVNEIIEKLISSGELKGKFNSNIYESEIYSSSQLNYIKGEILSNSYIDYSKLKNIGITQNGRDYLNSLRDKEKWIRDGVFLKECLISDILKSNFEFGLVDNMNKGTGLNLNSVFFFSIDEEDANTLLDSCGLTTENYIYLHENIIPNTVVENFVKSSDEELKELAGKEYNKYISKLNEPINQKKKEEKKEDEDDDDGGNKKKKKKKKGKKHDNEKSTNQKEATSNIQIDLPSSVLESFKKKFVSNPAHDELNEKEDTLVELFQNKIVVKLEEIYTKYIREFIKLKTNEATDPSVILSKINEVYLRIKLLSKNFFSFTQLSKSEPFTKSVNAIIAFLCKKELSTLLKDLLLYQIIHMKIKFDPKKKLDTHKERQELIGCIPDDDIRDLLNEMNEDIQNRNFNKFMECLEKSKILAASLIIYDKKEEHNQIEKFNSVNREDVTKLLSSPFILFKDYLTIISELCGLLLAKQNYFLRLPNEVWVVGIYENIFNEKVFGIDDGIKNIIKEINGIISPKGINPEDEYTKENDKLVNLVKELSELI